MNKQKIDDVLTNNIIKSYFTALKAKDMFTFNHSNRVARYSMLIGEKLKLNENELKILEHSACLHDIGKIAIRIEQLNKPGKLTETEWVIIKRHPLIGAEILMPLYFMDEERDIILYHHEKWLGGGYPEGRPAKNMSVLIHIVTLADCYDAMTSERSYRKKVQYNEAVEELERCSGIQFSPKIVETFKKIPKSFLHN